MGNMLRGMAAQGHPMLVGSSSCQLVPTLWLRLVTSAHSASLPSSPAASLSTPRIEYAGTSAPARPSSLSPANDIMRKRDLGRKGCVDLEASHPGILAQLTWHGQAVVRPSLSRTVQPVSCLAGPQGSTPYGTPEETSWLVAVPSAFDALLICAASDDIRPDIPSRTGRTGRTGYGDRASCGQPVANDH
ncbi:hypothetical protein DHEL01_v202644 [Diaporthe helianthi]|uniref:Uncharacterized protein n=1 Tax=Diaporthe helianthi TaxID=158607 RepID=A0A2P5I8X2_DIAHE|nr:hypothetical protein DHEL01_v202644 [Diaporthe helianthi]